jgi:hypothetical protein
MQQPTESLAKTGSSQKVIAAVLVTFLLFSSILFLLVRYYRVAQNFVSNPLEQQAVNMVEVEQAYRVKVDEAFDVYLARVTDVNLLTEQALTETKKIKDDILPLTVSTSLKDYHLSLILALSGLEQYLQTGDFSRANEQFVKVKGLVEKL